MPHNLLHRCRVYFRNLALLALRVSRSISNQTGDPGTLEPRVRQHTRIVEKRRLAALLLSLIACAQFSHASDVLNPGEHFANVNGVRLWYKVAGHGPILIIQAPGWGPGSTLLQRNLSPLEQSFTVVYFDPRGSGKSSRPAQDTQMSTLDMANDLEAFRSYLSLGKISVLGHSHGGQIAAVFAAKHPDRVSHLILVAAPPPKNPTPEYDAESKKIYDRLAQDPRYADAVKAVQEPYDTGEEFSVRFKRTAPLYWHDESKASALQGLPPIDMWAAASNGKSDSQVSYDLVPDLKKLSAPVLIIEGKDDLITPLFEQEVFKTNIPHSRLVIFEESGHFPFIEEPDKFFAVVTDFLRQ